MGVLEEILQNQKILLEQNVQIMKRLDKESAASTEYIDIEQLKERWGCAYFTVNKAMKNGLKYQKFGRRNMYSIKDIEEYEKQMNGTL